MSVGLELLDLGRRRVPLIRQSEAAECGLACLAMVAGYHGYRIDLASLRSRFRMSLRGATLTSLVAVADQIGLHARPLRGDPEDLADIALPAVLHWNLNHFVVLVRITRRLGGARYLIFDPASGERMISAAEFSSRFSGVVLELAPSERFEPQRMPPKMRLFQLWSRISGLKASLTQLLLLSLLLQAIALATPLYLQTVVDTVLPSFDAELLTVLSIGFAGLVAINTLVTWVRSRVLLALGSALGYQIVVNLFRHLLRLPLTWFERRHVGDIISRFGSTQPLTTMLSQGLIAAVLDGVMAIATLLLMMAYSLALTGVTALGLLVHFALRIAFLQLLKLRNVDAITAAAVEESAFIESVRGIGAIKAFGQEGNRQRLWQNKKATAVNASVRLGRLSAVFEAASTAVLGLTTVAFVYLAAKMAMAGDFSVGMIFAVQAYKQQFLDAGTRLVQAGIEFKMLDVHMARISDIALAVPESDAPGLEENAAPLMGAIELRGVRFAYAPSEPEVLRGVDLSIAAGETVAIIGPSGGGKTTLMKIMLGLLEPSGGAVLVDGQLLRHFGRSAYRGQIGFVAQDDVLYAGSLADNIAFFDPELDMERVIASARLAAIHDEVAAMPMRYETLVGDMGSALSGGQKQRVLLARALYRQPRLLLLDEGTAHLDVRTEAAVNAAVQSLGITRIIIAHRPETIRSASRVVALVDGRIVEARGAMSPAA